MSRDPSPNGDPPKPDDFEMYLEPVDASELNLEAVPTVEAVLPPPRWPGFGFWKAVLFLLLFLVVTQGGAGLFAAAYVFIAISNGVKLPLDRPDFILLPEAHGLVQATILFQTALTAAFAILMIRWNAGKGWTRRVALRLPAHQHVVLALIGLPALLVVALPLEKLVLRYLPTMKDLGLPFNMEAVIKTTQAWPWAIAVLAVGVGAAVGEELWFRGFMGQGLGARHGRLKAVIICSLMFGLIHVEPPQAVMAVLMGVILHLSYLASRSLLIPMLLHFLNNSLAVLAISETGNVGVLNSLEVSMQHRPVIFWAAAMLLLLVVFLAFYQTRVRIVTPHGTEAPYALYPHVELPPMSSSNKAIAGPLPLLTVGLLIATTGLFAAVWFGL
jgi:membrane protease YdiL (CAAX protease family)